MFPFLLLDRHQAKTGLKEESKQKLTGGDCFRTWFARAVTQHRLLPVGADIVMPRALCCKPCNSSTNQGRRVLSVFLKKV